MNAAKAGEEVWSIGRLLDWTHQFFLRKKIESARLDAELLLSHVLDCTRIELYTNYDSEVGDADRARFKEFVQRRSAYEPIAYLTGEREFYGLPFSVGPEVLIPRPETEHLVSAAVEFLKDRETSAFADVGVGSGCIAVCIANEVRSTMGVGFDVCSRALDRARENAERNNVADRLTFVESDLLSASPIDQFDLIVSNPPYVTDEEWSSLSPDVRDWEPKLALIGGVDGLAVYRKLIPEAAARLRPGGRLLLEIGSRQESEVLELLQATSLRVLPTVRDYGGRDRVVVADKMA
jgi:release factor glutamine methyltransferase